ncbi:MAG: molybdate ABC transporter substrate-binding protein [Clostridia bacterium]|nr:molybdate ABC transporter substrate-binding protein [Clostridia bacterium]
MKKLMLILIAVLILAGCQSRGGTDSTPREISVFAAASLTEAFTEVAREYENRQRGQVKIRLNFAGSQSLKTMIENGTRPEIFASANTDYMEALQKKNIIKDYKVFLQNKIVVVRNKSSKFTLKSLSDLSADGLKLAVGDKTLPAGMYWNKALNKALKDGIIDNEQKAGIEKNIKTKELNVKDIVNKVLLNEVDAGIVYSTDITKRNEEKLEEIQLQIFDEFPASYPIALVEGSKERGEAEKFLEYLMDTRGKEIFKKYKFITF